MRKKIVTFLAVIMILNLIIVGSNLKTAYALEITNPVETYVYNIYKNMLERIPDQTGFNYWVNKIKNGEISEREFLFKIINSSEFIRKQYDNNKYVTIMYTAILGRTPDSVGLQYWVNKLNNKQITRSDVVNSFVQSLEFKSRIVVPITIYINGDLGKFIERHYNYLLKRKPDEDGLKYWINHLKSKKITPAQFILRVINSSEFQNNKYLIDEYIKIMYRAMYDREADTSGLNYWVGKLYDGYSRTYVFACFVNSAEFKNTVSKFGFTETGTINLSSADYPSGEKAQGIVVNLDLNIYSEPNVQSNVINEAKIGSKVKILQKIRGIYGTDIKGDFYKVEVLIDNKVWTGYIRKKYQWTKTVEVYGDNLNNQFLGILSEEYESGGDAGEISSGIGDSGGKSYGAWQLSSNMGSLEAFVVWLKDRNSDYYTRLVNAMATDLQNTGNKFGVEFDKEWTSIANNSYDNFYNLQHSYIKEVYYDRLVSKLTSVDNYDSLLRSFAVRNVFWSTAVQHGVTGGYNIIRKIAITDDEVKFITDIYLERGRKDGNGILVYFSSNSLSVQAGVSQRFEDEKNDAITIWQRESSN